MSNRCIHCGLKSPAGDDFCCRGCEAAYNLIKQLGFGSYYQQRSLDPNTKPLKPEENIDIELGSFITKLDHDIKEINLMVEGLHCASCVWLIESILRQDSAVSLARINLSSRRLKLRWQGEIAHAKKLINLINSLGYKLLPYDATQLENIEEKKKRDLLKYLAFAGFASGNLMLISICLWSSSLENMGVATRDLLRWLSALIGLPVIIYAGQPFYKSAWGALRHKHTNMDVPISLALLMAGGMSVVEIITHGNHIYFESATMLLFFLLIGRFLDQKARHKAQSAAQDLLMLMSGAATTLEPDGKIKIIPFNQIRPDMIILTAAGEKIAADGIIIEGESEINNSAITGEWIPEQARAGSQVFAGTINLSAPIKIKVVKAGEDSLIASIIKLMEQAEQKKATFITLSDKIAKLYTPVVHILALITFIIWYFLLSATVEEALLNAITVLIITCPCALALAIPVVYIVASSRLFSQSILLKSGNALEKLAKIKNIVFDKTGTLTTAELHLAPSSYPPLLFQIAASMAARSKHPLSKALAANYSGELLDLTVEELTGEGLQAIYNNYQARLGKAEFCHIPPQEEQDNNKIKLWFTYQEHILCFEFSDELKEDAIEMTAKLQQKYNLYLLSGDRLPVVQEIAEKLSITNYKASCQPQEKLHLIEEIRATGPVLMVGDGLNDAPSLAAADVSMSPSSAIDISQTAADLVFQSRKIYPIIEALETSKKTYRVAWQNIFIAFGYNLVAIPAAMAGLVNPLIAAIAMSSSSLLVTLNSFQVKKR